MRVSNQVKAIRFITGPDILDRPPVQEYLKEGFNAALPEFEQLFLKRASDKKLDEGNVIDGIGAKYNQLVFDIRATALAHLARHRGMKIEYDSEMIPVASL